MSFHAYRINELYSNADGSVQFIEMSVGNVNGEGFWAGHAISVSQGGTTHNFTFPSDLPSESTANTKVLIATQGFADLGIVSPDFIVPAGFLFTNGGTVNYAGVDSVTYSSLPSDGSTSMGRSSTAPASPTNFAGVGSALSLISGGTGSDTLTSSARNDIINGGLGTDTVDYSGSRSSYTVTKTATGYSVADKSETDGTDTLSNIEQLKFTDMTVNLTVQANAASISTANLNSITELYVAYFNRVPDADGLSYWIDQFKGGMSLNSIGDSFYANAVSPAYASLTGYADTMSDTDFIIKIYQNVLRRTVTAADDGVTYWRDGLADHSQTRGSLVNTIIVAAHGYKGTTDYGWVADLLDNKLAVSKTFAVEQGLTYNSASDSITHGMEIAAAVTSTSTAEAIALIGIPGII